MIYGIPLLATNVSSISLQLLFKKQSVQINVFTKMAAISLGQTSVKVAAKIVRYFRPSLIKAYIYI
jgi:hypothetical protein